MPISPIGIPGGPFGGYVLPITANNAANSSASTGNADNPQSKNSFINGAIPNSVPVQQHPLDNGQLSQALGSLMSTMALFAQSVVANLKGGSQLTGSTRTASIPASAANASQTSLTGLDVQTGLSGQGNGQSASHPQQTAPTSVFGQSVPVPGESEASAPVAPEVVAQNMQNDLNAAKQDFNTILASLPGEDAATARMREIVDQFVQLHPQDKDLDKQRNAFVSEFQSLGQGKGIPDSQISRLIMLMNRSHLSNIMSTVSRDAGTNIAYADSYQKLGAVRDGMTSALNSQTPAAQTAGVV